MLFRHKIKLEILRGERQSEKQVYQTESGGTLTVFTRLSPWTY